MTEKDWTQGSSGFANTSGLYELMLYELIVIDVASIIRDIHVGDEPINQARLIVSRLAHHWQLAPPPQKALP